jgi:capsular polysaccharide biosynthesis protein
VSKTKIFSKIKYREFSPKILKIRNKVLVTSLGVCYTKCGPLSFNLYAYLYSVFRALFFSLGSLVRRGFSKVKGDQQYAIIHSQWTGGYYHWITESLPRAIQLKKEFPECEILLPNYTSGFHKESLELLGYEDIKVFPDKNLLLESLINTECPKKYATTSPDLLNEIRDKFKEKVGFDNSYVTSKVVYISRKKARGRYVKNENELIKFLSNYDIEVVCTEELSFHEQVKLFSSTKVLISIHGAGLTNMIFMPAGGAVIELLPYRNGIFDLRPNTLSFKHDPCFLRLAEAMGHEYIYIQNKHNAGNFSRTNIADIEVDLSKLDFYMRKSLGLL